MKGKSNPEQRTSKSNNQQDGAVSNVNSIPLSNPNPQTGDSQSLDSRPPEHRTQESYDGESQTEKIRELAYQLYIERGSVEGRDVEDWLEAEAIISQREKLAA
jgi:hypothetical protein